MRAEATDRRDALGAFVTSRCELAPAANNLPVSLDDPAVAWFVEHGAVDVFSVEHRDGVVDSPFKHVMRCESGRLVFAAEPRPDVEVRLILKGIPGSRMRRVPLHMLCAAAERDEAADFGADHPHDRNGEPASGIAATLIRQVDAWVEDFAAAIVSDIDAPPPADAQLVPGEQLSSAGVMTARQGVVWLAGQAHDAAFLGLESGLPDGPGLMPATAAAWVDASYAPDAPAVVVKSSAGLAEDIGIAELLRTALGEFHRVAIRTLQVNQRLLLADIANLRRARNERQHLDEHRARSGLHAVLANRGDADGADTPLISALRAVARHERIEVHFPKRRGDDEAPGLREMLSSCDVPHRRVRLAPEDRWWVGDSGAMLGFRRRDGHPLALLPAAVGRYRAFDPATGDAVAVSREEALEIREDAWLLYRPVADGPPGSATGLRKLFQAAGGRLSADLVRLAVAGLAAGLLSMAPAIAIGVLIDEVIPSGSVELVTRFSLALAGLAAIAALAHVLRGTAVMRLEGRIVTRMTAALMNRVLRVRPDAFRDMPAGELGTRISAFQRIRDRLAGAAVGALLSTIFMLPAFVVMFLYSPALGWLMSGLGLLALLATAAIAAAQIGPYRRYVEVSRRLAGNLLKYLNGIAKVRSGRSEGFVFAAWARLYREQKQAEMQVAALSEHVAALGVALPVLAGAIVFAVMLGGGAESMPLADFLVVYAVSGMFFLTIASLGAAFGVLAAFAPSCGEVRPILAAEIEPIPRRGGDVRLNGGLFFDQVRFRYSKDGPDVLSDVSIRAAPGEFVGIVGESGAGKSTLVKLALALETPSSGGVYYDGHDLAHLSPVAVRRQIGLVMQDATLHPGTILSNIIGDTEDLTEEDAWRAARLAAVDKDVAALPMRMATWISEDGGGLSGGQRQRLAIAAALVRKPRIVILDEATSWLDSATQQDAMARLEATAVTRVVIAHRLSTIRNANRIYVMSAAGALPVLGGREALVERRQALVGVACGPGRNLRGALRCGRGVPGARPPAIRLKTQGLAALPQDGLLLRTGHDTVTDRHQWPAP